VRIFISAKEMVREVERDLFEMGIRVQPATMQDKFVAADENYSTLEVQAYGYTLTQLDEDDLQGMIAYLGGNLPWAQSEARDRIDPNYLNPGESYPLMPVWEQFLRDGQFAYTYNERFREQLPLIIRELQVRPNTRQAVMTMYDRHQDMGNWGGKDRVPCSLTYQFYARGGQLHLIYTMRSCDFLTHFCHDVYLAVGLLQYVADQVGMQVGNFTHFIGSLHAYQKDMKARGIF
jgi:hypothetical protein